MKKIIIGAIAICFSFLVTAQAAEIDNAYLLGTWNIKGIKANEADEYRPPLQPGKLQFTVKGKMIETLGNNGAQIPWRYSTDGENIHTQFASIKKSWKIISAEDKVLIINHHLGIFKLVKE